MVGGADFSEIHIDPGDEVNSCSENDNAEGKGEDTNERKVPTMPEIARKVMVNDGRNPYTKLGKYLQQSMGGSTDTATNIENIIKQLKARGG